MKYIKFLLPVLLATCLAACKSDYHYANSFISKHQKAKPSAVEQIYVSLPNAVLHTNSSLNAVADFDLLSVAQQDSVIASLTALLDKVNDSLFLSQFNDMFLFTLSRLNVPIVVVDSPTLLPTPDSSHLTIDILQLEAEEFLQPGRSAFSTSQGSFFSHEYMLRHFATNVWFQFDPVDSLSTIYFKSNECAEQFSGTVTSLKDGKAKMNTSRTVLTVNDVYRSARLLGYQCATLYIEKLLTEYVARKIGSNKSYFYYNPQYNAIEEVVPYSEGIKDSFETL